MTIYLCISLVLIGMLLLMGDSKTALIAGAAAIAGGFGYRITAGEEIRLVIADALFCITLLPVGWWAAKQWRGMIEAQQATDTN